MSVMNGYLAVVRCAMDDIPILLADSEDLACKALATLTSKRFTQVLDTVGVDVSIVCSGSVYSFCNGKLTNVRTDIDLPTWTVKPPYSTW